MFKRPNRNDSEKEILEMQNEFLAQKAKHKSFQPAAMAVRVNKDIGQNAIEKNDVSEACSSSKSSTTPTEFIPVIGNIIEKRVTKSNIETTEKLHSYENGFPKPTRITRNIPNQSGKSLFALSRMKQNNKTESLSKQPAIEMNVEEGSTSKFGDQSYMVSTSESSQIHQDNVNYLESMSETDILQERQKILESLDPSLINFLQSKRQKKVQQEPSLSTIIDKQSAEHSVMGSNMILPNPELQEWHNSNLDVKLEIEKFEWMKDIPTQLPDLKPGESYEARFDWKGALLPYKDDLTDQNRHLYLHEEDVHRPGYTLQELFRLARSNIVQQRNAAIFSIAGILNIYNQGFYDGVLEVPISKIFFLLRFAFDDNTQSLLETSSKALATLLHNDSDEVLLDFIYECIPNSTEPIFDLVKSDNATLKSHAFNTNISNDMDDENATSLNDFYLAEMDLIKCVVRSNVIQRIYYILSAVKSDNSTVISCIKILIRLARADQTIAERILNHDLLIDTLCTNFLPVYRSITSKEFYGKPQFLLIKLLRIIAAYSSAHCHRLLKYKINDIVSSYIFIRDEINIDIIRLQMESFRLAKVLIILTGNVEFHNEIMSGLLHMLEWCYQFINIETNSSSIFRQHAASLLELICLANQSNVNFFQMLLKLKLCFSKWFHSAKLKNCEIKELSQYILLATCLRICVKFKEHNFSEFLTKYLVPFIVSKFGEISSNLRKESILLTEKTCRKDKDDPLPSIDSIVYSNATPTFILSEKYPVFLLNSIVALVNSMDYRPYPEELDKIICNKHLLNYFRDFSQMKMIKFRTNWFARIEIEFLGNILKCKKFTSSLNKSILQKTCHRFIYCATEHEISYVLEIYKLIFNINYYEQTAHVTQNDLDKWKKLYVTVCIMPNLQQNSHGASLCNSNYKNALFSKNWHYSPLLALINPTEYQDYFTFHGISEQDIITATLSFTALCKLNFESIVSPTEELIFLMMAFMGTETAFLDSTVKDVLKTQVETFFSGNRETIFDFNSTLEGKLKFETFYISFLEQFQATSYGDKIFSALLMVPLSMRYDIKWRNMVWFEHASVLRFITCDESQLIGTLNDYLYPNETNVDLLKSYLQMINSNMPIKNSIAYRIAEHHWKFRAIKAVSSS